MIKYIIVAFIGYAIAANHYGHYCNLTGGDPDVGVMQGHAYNTERTREAAKYPGLLQPEVVLANPSGRTQATGAPVPLK